MSETSSTETVAIGGWLDGHIRGLIRASNAVKRVADPLSSAVMSMEGDYVYWEWAVLDDCKRALMTAADHAINTGRLQQLNSNLSTYVPWVGTPPEVATGESAAGTAIVDAAPPTGTWQEGCAAGFLAAAEMIDRGKGANLAADPNDPYDQAGPRFEETLNETATQLRELAKQAAAQPPLF